MNVLVIAPHPDDEAIGCGGAVCLHSLKKDSVAAVFLTSGELGLKHVAREEAWKIREAETRAAAKVLGIADTEFLRFPDWTMAEDLRSVAAKLVPIIHQRQPDVIYLSHPNEWHPDHKVALPVVQSALKQIGNAAPTLLGYEVWTPMSEYQHVRNITEMMSRKLRAVRKHVSQVSGWDYVRAVRGLNEFRGAMAGRCRYAEVFQELSPS